MPPPPCCRSSASALSERPRRAPPRQSSHLHRRHRPPPRRQRHLSHPPRGPVVAASAIGWRPARTERRLFAPSEKKLRRSRSAARSLPVSSRRRAFHGVRARPSSRRSLQRRVSTGQPAIGHGGWERQVADAATRRTFVAQCGPRPCMNDELHVPELDLRIQREAVRGRPAGRGESAQLLAARTFTLQAVLAENVSG